MSEAVNDKLISVIIPAYNVEKHIGKCIDSLLAQSHSNLEIIVVDDGSADSTGRIIDDYAANDPRVKPIHKKNEGVARARNSGLDAVIGDMIAFADADDYMEPDMLKRLLETMISEGADLVSCGYYEEYDDRTELRRMGTGKAIYNKHEAYGDYFKMGGRLGSGCWNKLFKAEVLKDIRYKKYTMGEDVELISRALDKCDKIICIEYAGYHYVHREDSATQLVFRPANMDIIHVVEEMADYIRENHPELIKQLYGFHAAWHVAVLQVLKKSKGFKTNRKEVDELRSSIKSNMVNYRGNPYVYKVDYVLLVSFLLHCFSPVQSVYGYISYLRHKK